jgi:hypothetical protein
MTATIASRMARKGDRVQGMAVQGRTGIMWAGEFHTVLGDGTLGGFLGQSDRTAIGSIFLTLEDGTTVVTDVRHAFTVDRW